MRGVADDTAALSSASAWSLECFCYLSSVVLEAVRRSALCIARNTAVIESYWVTFWISFWLGGVGYHPVLNEQSLSVEIDS